MAKRKNVLERKTLNKEERAHLKIIKQKFNIKRSQITQKDFLSYLKQVEKANQKLSQLSKRDDFLGRNFILTTELEKASNLEQFYRWFNKPLLINNPDYERKINEDYINLISNNLTKVYGKDFGIQSWTSKKVKEFITRNSYLDFLMEYMNEEELNERIELFGESKKSLRRKITTYRNALDIASKVS